MITMISNYQIYIYIYIYEFQNINKDIQKLLKSKSPVHFNGVNLHKYEDFLTKAKRFLQHFINPEEPYLVQVYVLFRRRKHIFSDTRYVLKNALCLFRKSWERLFYSLGPTFVDYQNFVGSLGRNFVGTTGSLLPYSAGQFIILLYVSGDINFLRV